MTVLDESLDIMVWALKKHDPGNWLPKDTITMEDTLSLINANDSGFKHNLDRYKYGPRFNVEDTAIHRDICEAFIKDLLILFTDNLFFELKTKSTNETFGVGTLIAKPSSFPFSSGIISARDFEAPVEVGTID